MRKLIRIFILALLFNISMVKAADFNGTISGTTSVINGSTYTYDFKVSTSNTIAGISGTVNYDKTKLELVSASAVDPFTLNFNNSTGVYNARYDAGKTGTFTYMRVKFKVKSMSVGDSTSISISNLKGTKLIPDENGKPRSYSATGSASKITLQVKSTNNNLSNLTVDSKTVANFKSGTTSYKMTVENTVSKVTIGATAADSKAKISGVGTKNLSIYNNTFKVVVTAESGATKTYTIVIVRKDAKGYAGARSSDNKLKSLKVEGYEIDFSPETKSYELEVNNEVVHLDIEAIVNDSNAKVEINNNPLAVGLNEIEIKVTAEDESVNTYVLKVTRNNDNPVTTIDKFEEIAANTTKDTIEILVNDDIITKEELEKIKNSGKNIIFAHYEDSKLIYAWHILNSDIKTDVEFNTKVSFTNDNKTKINNLTNYAEAFYISSLNQNKSVAKLKVLTDLTDNTKLYYYDSEKIYLQEENVEVNDSYVEIPFLKNDYFLSRMEIKNNNNKGLTIILVVENVLIAGFCIALIVMHKKKDVGVSEEV